MHCTYINLYIYIYSYIHIFCTHITSLCIYTYLLTHVVMKPYACVWCILMKTLFTTVVRYALMRCERFQRDVSSTFSVVSYHISSCRVASRIVVAWRRIISIHTASCGFVSRFLTFPASLAVHSLRDWPGSAPAKDQRGTRGTRGTQGTRGKGSFPRVPRVPR